jgi:spermidine/putrescine transport system substrate-binding protein
MGTDERDGLNLGGNAVSRRAFLKGAAAAGLSAGTVAAISACDGSTTGSSVANAGSTASASSAASTLPSPENPVTWPVHEKPIASGLRPEKNATLRIYNWDAYLSPQVIKDFCNQYQCKSELTTYGTMPEGVEKLLSGQVSADVFFPRVDVLRQLILGNLIQPLNHSYFTNYAQVWSPLTNPFYDVGWQYTVPYTVYTTGITWRKDHVPPSNDPTTLGWATPWQSRYTGKVAVLDDYREGLALGLLRNGIDDLNTSDPAQIDRARNSLIQLGNLTNVHVDLNDYTNVPSGQIWIHQAFSGDMAAAASYIPKGTSVDVIGYWFPPDGRGPVGNDTVTIPRSAQNPVLAHLFVNYLLDLPNALENISYIGYMQPIQGVTAQRLVGEKILPPSLTATVVHPGQLATGLRELQVAPATDALYEQAWQQFTHGI